MGMATAKFTELPLRTTFPFASHYPSSSSRSPSSLHFFFHSSSNSLSHQKPTFSLLLKPFCSLSTTSQDHHQKPSQNPSNSPLKPKPTSTTHWLNKWTSGHTQHEPNVRALNPRAVNSKSESRAETRVFDGAAKTSAIERIVLRLRNLGLGSDDEDDDGNGVISAMPVTGEEKLGDLLRRDWVRPDTILAEDDKENEMVLPWERGEDGAIEVEEDGRVGKKRTVKGPTLAELTIEDSELRRLRRLGMTIRERISVAKAGVTGEVLEKIHDKWRKCELVRLKFHESLANDMKTAHEIVERRTGGLVVWRSGRVMVVYRGSSYEGPSFRSHPINREDNTLFVPDVSSADNSQGKDDSGNAYILDKSKPVLPVRVENMSEEEAEYKSLLDGLGPRFEDWWGTGVLPVDADLLPQTIPGYRTPFRLLPTGMRSCLTNAEMTNLRKLAKSLPCHFALGRNRNHQGLAGAIVKLWEKSLVAKIAVKRGIQNTNNKLMAEELKLLTGGVLLLRNKYFIVIYRGKDFLPTSVATALDERQEMTKKIQDVEERVRRGDTVDTPVNEDGQALAGTLAEFYEAQARWGRETSAEERQKMVEKSLLDERARVVKRLEHKLAIAQAKKLKAERLLSKIVSSWVPVGPSDDQETITDEERVMYRRVGLRMKAYLPLGIRGVFDGVIENMHLHWKHRELVKLISKEKELALVEETARLLEYESEGILVAIERVPKGYALIYYRGKNYRRPITLRPRNLLTKAKALKRRVALQRYEALSQHISALEKTIQQTKLEIGNSQDVENTNAWNSNGYDHFSQDSDISQSEDEASWLGSDDNEEDYLEEGKESEYTTFDNHDQVSSVTAP